MQKLLEL